MKIPKLLLKRKENLEDDKDFRTRMIKSYTDDWVKAQKELIEVNEAIERLT